MNEGCIIYVAGEEPPRKDELDKLIRENNLDLFEYRVCGHAPSLPGVYRAYRELQERKVAAINCFSVSYDRERAEYRFLDQNLNLGSVVNLENFCSPDELGR